MDVGVYILGATVLLFSIVFGLLDFNINASMKQNLFESVRAANQNSLISLESKYGNREILTTCQMIETWLCEFASDRDLNYKEVEIDFVQVETEPPLYLVNVKGFVDKYAIVSEDAYAEYFSGATIISKEQ